MLAYAVVVSIGTIRFVQTAFIGPVLLVMLGVPLIFRLVPRNYLYGLRTRSSLGTTMENWYSQNQVSGVVLVLAGIVWFAITASR